MPNHAVAHATPNHHRPLHPARLGARAREDYLVEFCGMTEEEADKGRYDLYKGHGLTVGGLVAKGYDVDFDHWHSYVVSRRAGGCCCCVCPARATDQPTQRIHESTHPHHIRPTLGMDR